MPVDFEGNLPDFETEKITFCIWNTSENFFVSLRTVGKRPSQVEYSGFTNNFINCKGKRSDRQKVISENKKRPRLSDLGLSIV